MRPGADTALVDGVINHVISNTLYDEEYLRSYTVAPYLVHPDTQKLLRTSDIGLDGDDYVVVDADGQPKAAGDHGVQRATLSGTHEVGGLSARTAFQVLADTMAKYTPEYTAQVTDILARLRALDAQRGTLPIPKGPVPTSMKGMRGNLRGR